MKLTYNILILFACIALLPSCERWLDVKPKAQVEADVLYQRESGFKDVLWGVYVSMAAPSMYGREMGFGFADVIGGAYASAGTSGSTYNLASRHEYDNTAVEAMIGSIWQSSYNTIANLNSLIGHLKKADSTMFQPDNYNVILGEALGLRAYLHFDLLRLFGPSYKVNPVGEAIPYVTRSGFSTTMLHNVAAVADSILNDLKAAEALLKRSDPMVTGRNITVNTDEGYLTNRAHRFNYFAVKAAMARLYLYRSDFERAALCADEVIGSPRFRWTTVDEVAVANDALRDRTFSPEQVFVLNTPRMSDNIIDRLQLSASGSAGSASLSFLTADINRLYPEANDWRRLYFWSQERSGASPQRFCTKLWQPEGMPATLAARMPLIRLPELFLISAEAALPNDPDKAIARLRTLRQRRGLEPGIPSGTTEATLRNEIMLEYRREFLCEGVLFYAYKRVDAATMDGVPGNFDRTKYVLPKPQEEMEFR